MEAQLDSRSDMLDERLDYWRKEYDWQIQGRFDQINAALLEQIGKFEQDMSEQHLGHINDITMLKRGANIAPDVVSDASPGGKHLVLKVARL